MFNRSKSLYYYLVIVAVFFLSMFTDLEAPLIFTLAIAILLFILDKLGKGIVLRELIALHTCFVCLIMPWVGYQWYTVENPLARMWVRYMPVPETMYFNFTLPAVSGFITALCLPIKRNDVDDEGEYMFKYILRLRVILERKPIAGIQILLVGLIATLVTPFLPSGLEFVGNLLAWSAFAGILYVYFTPKLKYRNLILITFVLLIVEQALQQSMFTIVAYMGITIFSFLFLQKHSPMWKKLSLFIVGVFTLLIIQNVKSTYRRYTWFGTYQGDKLGLFADLISQRLGAGVSTMFTPEALFPVYYRTNQGFNIGLVMRRFPAIKEFDNGSKLSIDAASSLVPRFLWPDKPKAGGQYNMKYYTGIVIDGWSTNVGPVGEAYGSFGVTGGIIYMFVLGLFVRMAYALFFRMGRKIPLLILWMPVMFYQVTYSAENDSLQILNSLIKSAVLVYVLYKALPTLFGIGRHLRKANQAKLVA